MTEGRDGNVWITEGANDSRVSSRIVRATPDGRFSTFTIPQLTRLQGAHPQSGNADQITPGFGRDGNLYSSVQDVDQDVPQPQHELGRIRPAGRVTIFTLPFPSGPNADSFRGDSADGPLAAGPDGEIYFIREPIAGDGATHLERLNLRHPGEASR